MNILKLWERFKRFSIQFSQPHKRSSIKRYLFPLVLILIIFPIKLILQMNFVEGAPYLLSTFIVILSAWFGGLGPGIFATVLAGTLSDFLFLEPRFAINFSSVLTFIIFLIQGILISMISEAKRSADLQKDEFISFASHELKNPLAVVKGYLGMLQKQLMSKNKKVLEQLQAAETHTDRVTTLINELLDVTKIESGKLSLHKERFDLAALIKTIIHDQQLLSTTHKIKLESVKKSIVYGDKSRITQVITNMITNAIKYSPGKKYIVINLSKRKENIIISVQDFGIGVPENVQRKIFNRFYRVSETQTQGLGLGLFIAEQIARLHQGNIWLTSKVHKGTTFFFSLPEYRN